MVENYEVSIIVYMIFLLPYPRFIKINILWIGQKYDTGEAREVILITSLKWNFEVISAFISVTHLVKS